MDQNDLVSFIDAEVAKILEHVDAVQILVSWNEQAISKNLYRGGGNWFARQGMAHDFINQDVAQENAKQLADKLEPPPDDAESWKKA